ncbi:hypothetical protein QMY03_15945 [Arthrobacter sp. KFRI-F3372]|nr:hypothetical protein QMY03_15945 [Arthrobacter sp. KFRI-F3372]
MVAATVEDSDDCYGFIQNGIRDHNALPEANRSQSRTEVFPRQTTVGKIGKTLTEGDYRFSEACRGGGRPGVGDEIVKLLNLLQCFLPEY